MINQVGKMRHLLYGCILGIVLLCRSSIEAEAAEEHEKIKVGYFAMSGYQEKTQDGNRWGFGYDYLQEIAKYTDWQYEFVDGTWEESLERLERGEVDLVTCAKWSEERDKKFDYPNYRMGVLYSVLTVREDNNDYYYDDFENFDGMVIGMMSGNQANVEMREIAQKYDISFHSKQFETEKEMKEALQSGEIDAILSSNQRVLEQEKMIAKFEIGSFYAIVKEGNKERIKELNNAFFQIITEKPYFEANLYHKYFSVNAGYQLALTRQEQEYIEQHPTIRVVASPDAEPNCYYKDSKYQGIIIESIEAMAEGVGLKVEYIPTKSYTESLEYVKSGKADVIGDFYTDYSWADRNNFLLTDAYLEMKYVAVTQKGKEIPPDDAIVASCKDTFFNNMYVYKHYDEKQVLLSDKEVDSIDAVREGLVDVAYLNQYTAQALLKKDRYLQLTGNTVYGSEHGISLAVSENNKMLYEIMDKAIVNVQDTTISRIIEENTLDHEDKVSLVSYIYYNMSEFVMILFIIFALIILSLLYIMFQKKKFNQHIFDLAYSDRLTRIPNINHFEELGEKRRHEQRNVDYFILSLDISHFAIINESYGRNVGDIVIQYVAKRLLEISGPTAIVARNKVDNFVVMHSFIHQEEIFRFVNRVREEISCYLYAEGNEIRLNYNCGVVELMKSSGISIRKSIDRAELARKLAKLDRFQTKVFNNDMEKQMHREKIIEDSFEKALEKDEFKIYYQPKYNMENNKIIGAEALVRWISEENGFMSPDEFIPILEDNGSIIELDFFVLESVYALLHRNLQEGKEMVPISVNQSRLHFIQENYIERLNKLRDKYQVPNELIELELTESIFASIKEIRTVVTKLKENGFYLSVDDFGAGYSSLNMLKEIPLDTLKIDKDFITHDGDSTRYRKVVQKVVELAKELEMNIICEGVEYEEQAEFLQSVGCIYAQGFLYAKPMPEEEFLERILTSLP